MVSLLHIAGTYRQGNHPSPHPLPWERALARMFEHAFALILT
jgi:hypothetical protein